MLRINEMRTDTTYHTCCFLILPTSGTSRWRLDKGHQHALPLRTAINLQPAFRAIDFLESHTFHPVWIRCIVKNEQKVIAVLIPISMHWPIVATYQTPFMQLQLQRRPDSPELGEAYALHDKSQRWCSVVCALAFEERHKHGAWSKKPKAQEQQLLRNYWCTCEQLLAITCYSNASISW